MIDIDIDIDVDIDIDMDIDIDIEIYSMRRLLTVDFKRGIKFQFQFLKGI